MKTAKEIREYYDKQKEKEIKLLQKICKHISSKWCEEWWAPGHSTGRTVRLCDRCEKVLETKKWTMVTSK